MMCGIPGSGKSTFAEEQKEFYESQGKTTLIVCPDKVREKWYGDASIQGDGNAIFSYCHEEILNNLDAGNNVIFDATNIHSKDRRKLLRKIDMFVHQNVQKIIYYFPITINEALDRQENRDRKVPKDVVERMYNNFQQPTMDEGWDVITKV